MNATYICAECGTVIEEGQFMAVVGHAPAAGLSAPIGRADKLFDEVGEIYCADCFRRLGRQRLTSQAD